MRRSDPHRRTGRTFRMLLRALLAASEGEAITVEMDSGDYAKETARKALHMAAAFCPETCTPHDDGSLRFTGGGVMRFTGRLTEEQRNERLRGGGDVRSDHYDRRYE